MTGLQDLELAGAGISDLQPFAPLTRLERLNLSYTDISDANLAALHGLDRLRYLDLTSTDIGDNGLAQLKPLTGLTDLLLNYGRFTDKGLQALAALPNLQRLEVARTRVTDAGVGALAGLTHLQHLNLNYTKVTDTGIATLKTLTKLTDLDLDSAGVTDAGIDALQAHSSLEGAESLSHASDGERVRKTENRITRVPDRMGSGFIAAEPEGKLNEPSSFRSLLICAVSSLALSAASRPFSWIDELGGDGRPQWAGQITSVDLSGTWVTDAELGTLASIPTLTRINLAHTRISDQGLAPIAAAHEHHRFESALRGADYRRRPDDISRLEADRTHQFAGREADRCRPDSLSLAYQPRRARYRLRASHRQRVLTGFRG